jgi:hypothetical protein
MSSSQLILDLPRVYFPKVLPTETMYAFHAFYILAISATHHYTLDFIILRTLRDMNIP